jgi:competence protein ComEC
MQICAISKGGCGVPQPLSFLYSNRVKKVLEHGLWGIVAILFVATIFIWQAAFRAEAHEGLLTVAFLDVGQGDAVYIEGPNGNQVLVDGGRPDGKVLSELGKVMPFGDRTIDMLVITNPDQDHFGGFLDVLKTFETEYVLEPGTRTPNPLYHELKRQLEEKGIGVKVAERGQIIDLGGGVTVKIIFPDRDVSNFARNDGSIVMRLDYGSTSIMLTGDTTKITEEYIVNHYPEDLDSNILKVAHHGSKTSTSPNFVKLVSPEYAVISLGADNTYGHPHQVTLDTLATFGMNIFRTDLDGTIIMRSDGQSYMLGKY